MGAEKIGNSELKIGNTGFDISDRVSNLAMNTINCATYCGDCGGVMIRKGVRMVCLDCPD